MKKFFTTLLFVGAFALGGCSQTLDHAATGKKLEEKGYSVDVHNGTEETVKYIRGLNVEGFEIKGSIVATKGADKDKDALIAVFLPSIDSAAKFAENNNNENLFLLQDWARGQLGENLELKAGYHNNVVYAGSTVAADIAGFRI